MSLIVINQKFWKCTYFWRFICILLPWCVTSKCTFAAGDVKCLPDKVVSPWDIIDDCVTDVTLPSHLWPTGEHLGIVTVERLLLVEAFHVVNSVWHGCTSPPGMLLPPVLVTHDRFLSITALLHVVTHDRLLSITALLHVVTRDRLLSIIALLHVVMHGWFLHAWSSTWQSSSLELTSCTICFLFFLFIVLPSLRDGEGSPTCLCLGGVNNSPSADSIFVISTSEPGANNTYVVLSGHFTYILFKWPLSGIWCLLLTMISYLLNLKLTIPWNRPIFLGKTSNLFPERNIGS